MSVAATLYWVVGISGYVLYRQRTAGDVLRNLGGVSSMAGGMRGVYEHALKLCYGLAILGAVPLVISPFYSVFMPIIGKDPRRKSRRPSFNDLASELHAHLLTAHDAIPTYTDPHIHQHEDHPVVAPSFLHHTLITLLVLGAPRLPWLPL